MNNQQLEWTYNKANTQANWSFLAAFIMPIAGIILASTSLTSLNWLMRVNQNEDTAYMLQSTHRKAAWGIVVSIFLTLIWTIIVFGVIAASSQNALNTNCTFKTSGDIYNMQSTTHCE